jgi:hypothetical protein
MLWLILYQNSMRTKSVTKSRTVRGPLHPHYRYRTEGCEHCAVNHGAALLRRNVCVPFD